MPVRDSPGKFDIPFIALARGNIRVSMASGTAAMSAAARETSRCESNGIIRFDEPIFLRLRCAAAVDPARVLRIVRVYPRDEKVISPQFRREHTRAVVHVRGVVHGVRKGRTHTSRPLLHVSAGRYPTSLNSMSGEGERRRSDHKFRFPSRRETIRFHLAIYIRAGVTYVRQIEPENRAHVSWRSREAPAASRGCLSYLSSSLTNGSLPLSRTFNLRTPNLHLFRQFQTFHKTPLRNHRPFMYFPMVLSMFGADLRVKSNFSARVRGVARNHFSAHHVAFFPIVRCSLARLQLSASDR